MFLRQRQQAGITLAEVLVAIAILLVGVFAVMRVFPAGLKVIQNDRMSDIATQLNRQRLAFYRAQPALGRASQVTQSLPPEMDRLSGAFLHQPLMVPDAVVLMTSVSADATNLFLPYGEVDNVERRLLSGRTWNPYDVQPNFLPASRVNLPTGCVDPEDPNAPWCHAMAAWKRVIGEPHVVQDLTDGTGSRFVGIVLGHAPIYFNPPQGNNPPDPLNPVFYTETPVPVPIDASSGTLLGLAPGTYKVSYHWIDKNDVEHGVSEEMFVLPAAGNYVVAAAFERGNVSSLWGGSPGKTGRLLEGTVHVVRVDWVPAAPAMIRTAVGMDKVGLVDLSGVTGALPGAIVKANYTIHVTYNPNPGPNNPTPPYQPAWRVAVEEFQVQPYTQDAAGRCGFGRAESLFRNLTDDPAVRVYFLRREGDRLTIPLGTDASGNCAPGFSDVDLRSGTGCTDNTVPAPFRTMRVMFDPSDTTDSVLLFSDLLSGSCPPVNARSQPTMRAVLESLGDWSHWTEVAAKTYLPHCPNDPTTPLTQACPPPPLGSGQNPPIPQPYREYQEERGVGLNFRPSEVGKVVLVDYLWFDTSTNQLRKEAGERHTISDLGNKFGFALHRPPVSILQVRGVSVKAHTSWNGGTRYRQVTTEGYTVPPQQN